MDAKVGQFIAEPVSMTVTAKKSGEKKCNHTFTKKGEKCRVKVTTENGFCSKHRVQTGDKKELSLKKWRTILLSQIPGHIVDYYEQEDKKRYLDGTKLNRTTANNVAAWIMYETCVNDDCFDDEFHEQMRMSADSHPLDRIAKYFDPTAPAPLDVNECELYNQYKTRYNLAKKIYESQYKNEQATTH